MKSIAIVAGEFHIFAFHRCGRCGRIYGIFAAYLFKANAGKSNVCAVRAFIASCGVNEYQEVFHCSLRTFIVISNGKSNTLACRDSQGRAAPSQVSPNVAAYSTLVASVSTASVTGRYPNSTLDIKANARVSGAVVGNGDSKGVLVASQLSDGSGNGLPSVSEAVIFNVEAVDFVAGACFGREVQRGFYGRCRRIYGIATFGDVFTAEFHVGQGDRTLVSGFVIILRAVNEEFHVGRLLRGIVNHNQSRGCACFYGKGRAAPSQVGVSFIAVLGSRKVASGSVFIDLGLAFHINTDFHSRCAVVGDSNGENVLCACNGRNICPEVFVGIAGNIVVNHYNGVAFVYIYAVAIGNIALEGNGFTVDSSVQVAGYGVFGGRGRYL